MMRHNIAGWLVLGLVTSGLADVQFTSPAAGATIGGGKTISIQWKDSGTDPPISDLNTYDLFLCAGGNDEKSYIQLTSLASAQSFSTGNAASGVAQVALGGEAKNAYFLKMISTATSGTTVGTVINFSDRFTLSGMTGTFPANVQQGIKGISGTDGPATQNNINNNAGAGAGPGGAAGFGTPYAMQTGPTKYAPMQKKPGTKITAKAASMLYPKTSVEVAKRVLPTPTQVTTYTMSGTYAAVASIENTASALPGPDAMQKYLRRWQDDPE